MEKDLTILGIESSCDETAASVVRNGREVLSSVVSTQILVHRKFGGVVPGNCVPETYRTCHARH